MSHLSRFSWSMLGVLVLLSGLPAAERVVVGKCATESGTILRRQPGAKNWEAVKKGEPIYSGDLNVGLPGAAIDSTNGAVRIELLADLDGTSPFPILESAVILNASDKADLDFRLDRGRIDIVNLKKKDKVTVKVHFHHEHYTLHMEPDSEAAMELYGRWAAGVYCNLKLAPEKQECPTGNLAILMLRGEMVLDDADRKHAMKAPPGPALFMWDSIVEEDVGPRRLEKLPAWADADAVATPLGKRKKATLEIYRQRVLATSPEKAINEAVASSDYGYRRLGVVVLGATDNISKLIDVLGDAKSAEGREAAILVLRHWLGRCRGQDPQLFEVLTKEKGYSPAKAQIVLHLLHSMGEAQLGRPETYETLIDYLMHDKVPIRELAHWHLVRLVPLGGIITYDAGDSAEKRQQAFDRWKRLIPDGQLPPREKIKQKLKDAKEKLGKD
jgi:hypothetical protein